MKLHCTTLASALVAILVLGGGLPDARAEDDIRATARASAEKSSKAIVTVKLVVAMKMMGEEQEQKLEVAGTVIDPSGLTVVSASEIDPSSLFKALMGNIGGMGAMDSIVKETQLILDDGTEVDADVVLKDADLDLAFIRPRDTTREFEAIELKPRGKPPEMLEDIFVLTRLGRLHNRTPSISLGKVKAYVKGPRPYTVCDSESSSGTLGCVAFDAKGAPLGLFVMKHQPAGASDSGSPMGFLSGLLAGGGSSFGPAAPILRSVEDVLEIAEQAKAAKPPERESSEEGEEEEEGGAEEGEEEPEPPAKEPPSEEEDEPPEGEDEE